MKPILKNSILVSLSLVASLAAAPAARAEFGGGIQGGVMVDDIDGFFFGGHAFWQDFPGLGGLRVEPGAEFGIGDEFFMIRFFAHGKYLFQLPSAPVALYPLLGVEFDYFNVDGPGDGITEAGLDLGFGARFFDNLSVQLWFGAGDIPNLNLSALYDF